MRVEKFCATIVKDMARYATKYPDVWDAALDHQKMEEYLIQWSKQKGKFKTRVVSKIPADLVGLSLNFNLAAKGKEDRFFMTHPDETVSRVSGEAFLTLMGIKAEEAAASARKVIPDYLPRGQRGVTEIERNGKIETLFNVYTPPDWVTIKNVPDKLPVIFEKLVNHLFPLPIEREYFYAWLHESLFNRAFVFLVLCGAPGTGKNRLKLVLRALHGHVNSIDGKKSTLVERFNSQLSESTLAWFDELHYSVEMENTMKELQNDSISIERKGVDATRATQIHASIVISNNKPRDNYIAFDARKFAPLVINPRRLDTSMKPEQIDLLTKKVENVRADTFDSNFIAQIALWVKKHGPKFVKKWPNLEYRGPMFWTLAHTSMSRWQKKAIVTIMGVEASVRWGYDEKKKAFLWSVIQEKSQKKNGDKSLQFPDYTSVMAFFDVFRDSEGRKAFETNPVIGNIMGDFWVKPLFKKMDIVTEVSLAEQRNRASAKTKEKGDEFALL